MVENYDALFSLKGGGSCLRLNDGLDVKLFIIVGLSLMIVFGWTRRGLKVKSNSGIINITNSRNTKRTDGQPSEQLFPKRWRLSNIN